jgi:hypothetical protein
MHSAINLYLPPLVSLPSVCPLRTNEREQSLAFMSLTGQATSSTSSFQLIVDALADYAKDTGIGLSKNPFAAALEQSNSPEALLQLLQDRAGRRPSKNIATETAD